VLPTSCTAEACSAAVACACLAVTAICDALEVSAFIPSRLVFTISNRLPDIALSTFCKSEISSRPSDSAIFAVRSPFDRRSTLPVIIASGLVIRRASTSPMMIESAPLSSAATLTDHRKLERIPVYMAW